MVSVPFYLVILIELLILESLAIAGFFVFRWWREKQDQAVLEALITATETSASARNLSLKAKISEAVPKAATELAETAESLVEAEILFQRRILAAFRNYRLLSLGHLPTWTDELLIPYQSLIESLQSSTAASVREHQREIEHELETTKAELTVSKEELQQSQKQIESMDLTLNSTQSELAEKTAKIESLEQEYVSAFHTPHNAASAQAPAQTAPAAETTTTPTSPEPIAPKPQPPTAAPQEAAALIIENDDMGEENQTNDSPPDDVVNPVDQSPEKEGEPGSPSTAQEPPQTSTETSPSSESELLILDEEEDEIGADLDWGSALAEQAASSEAEQPEEPVATETESANSEEDLDWGSALAEQAASGDAEKPESPPVTNAESTDIEDDLDWGNALAEQAAIDAVTIEDHPVKETG